MERDEFSVYDSSKGFVFLKLMSSRKLLASVLPSMWHIILVLLKYFLPLRGFRSRLSSALSMENMTGQQVTEYPKMQIWSRYTAN